MKSEKFILIILSGILIFLLPIFADAACDYHNVWGWAWSENIGWISFSCRNCDTDGDGVIDNPECSAGSTVNYGVDIDDGEGTPECGGTAGEMCGFAWAGGGEDAFGVPTSTIGWIHFAPAGPYPAAPDYSAKVSTITGEVSGWARACSVFQVNCSGALKPDSERGGWDGWIKLRGTWTDGVLIDNSVSPAEFHGWAWGGDDSTSTAVIGWISFNCQDTGTCPSSDYKVMTDFTFVPPVEISDLDWNFDDPCGQSRIPVFSWQTDAEMPYDYQIRLCSNSACTGPGDPLVSDEVLGTSSATWTPACSYCCSVAPYNNISFGGLTYYGQVRARNIGGEWSGGWVNVAFTTENHCYPYIYFDWVPDPPSVGQVVEFRDRSVVFNGKNSWEWTFPAAYECVDPEIGCEIAENPQIKFSTMPAAPNNEAKLEVTDSWGYGPCSKKYPITVTLPLPEYREVAPTSWLDNFFARLSDTFFRF